MIYRKSKQGEIILNILKQEDFHPSASDLYDLVKREIPDISLATVYRNLEKLIALDQIWKFKIPNGVSKYDGNMKKHYHIICSSCGKTKDVFVDTNFKDYLDNKFSVDDFYDVKIGLTFQGVCSKCKNKEKLK